MTTANSTYNSEEGLEGLSKQQRALRVVKNFMEDSRRYTNPYFEKFSKLFEEYLVSKAQHRNKLQRAQLSPPYAWVIVETYTPAIIEAFFADKPYVSIKGREPTDMQFEEVIEQYLSYQMDRMGMIENFTPFIKDLILFGTAIAKTPWRKEYKYTLQETVVPNEKGEPTVKKVLLQELDKDQPEFEPIPIWDFFPDWTTAKPGDIDCMRGVVHRVWRTFDELKKHEKQSDGTGIYTNLDKLKENLDDDQHSNRAPSSSMSDYSRRDNLFDLPNDLRRKDKIEIWEYWGEFDPNGSGKFYQYVITVADGSVVLRCDINPLKGQYKPFLCAIDNPISGEFYGVGDIEPVWSIIKEAKALRNARLDAVNMAVNPMWIVDRAGGINLRSLYTRSGGVILSNGTQAITRLEPPEVVGSSFNEINDLDLGIQRAVALPDPTNLSPGLGRTAQGIQYAQGYNNSRLSLKVRLLAAMTLNKLAKRLMIMNAQFLNTDVFVRVTGQQVNPFLQIPLQAFQQEWDYSASSAFDRLTRKDRQAQYQQNIIPLLQLTSQFDPMAIKWPDLAKDALRDFDFRNTEKYFRQDEEKQQMQQSQVQQQMMMTEHNFNAQARAQAMMAVAKAEAEGENEKEIEEMKTSKDMVKLAVNTAQQDENNDQTMSRDTMKNVVSLVNADKKNKGPSNVA